VRRSGHFLRKVARTKTNQPQSPRQKYYQSPHATSPIYSSSINEGIAVSSMTVMVMLFFNGSPITALWFPNMGL
jgi:hypothetical protein